MSWQILIDYGDGWVDITGYGGDNFVRDSLKLTEKLHDDDFKPALGSATFSATLTPALAMRLLQCTGDIPCEIYRDGVIWFRGFSRPVTKYKVTDNDRTIDFEIYDYGYLLESTLQDDVMISDGKICDPDDPDHSIVHILLASAGYPSQYIGIRETINKVIPKLAFASGDSYADDLEAILWDYHHLYNVFPDGVIDIYDWASSSVEADGAFSEQNIIGSLEVERKDSEAEQVQVSFNQYEKLTGLTLYYEKVDKWESIASNSGQDAEGPALWPADGPYRCDYNLDIGSSNYEIVGAENQKLELHGYTWVSFGPEPGHSTWIDILGMGQLFGVYDLVMENHATTYSEFQFNLADGQLINEIKVTGDLDIVYKDQKKTSVFSRPESTGKLKKYSANYLYDDDAATELANALYSSITTGRLHYTFKSLTEKSLGSYVTVSSLSLGISNTVRITSRSWDVETEIWEYEGVSVAPLETILGTVVAGQIVVPTNPDEAKSVAERVDVGLESDGSIIQPVNGNQLVDIDTTVAGLYMTASALGFFDGEEWTAVINNDGTWSFLGDGNNYIKWDGGTLQIHGDLFLSGDSELRGKITAGNGIESDDYKQGGVSGWKIGGDGDAFFNNVWLRGDLYGILHDLTIDGNLTLSGGAIKAGDTILDASGIRANAGRVGNWLLSSTAIRSDEVGKARIELDPGDNRIEVWGAAGAEPRVAMGYLGGLSDPSDRAKSLASTIFGFWTADGDSIEIRGEMRLVDGQYVLQDDAALEIQDSTTGKAILRVGSNAGRQGVHFFDETEAPLLSLVADGIKAAGEQVIFGKARSAFTSYPAGMPDEPSLSIEPQRLITFTRFGSKRVYGYIDLANFVWDGEIHTNTMWIRDVLKFPADNDVGYVQLYVTEANPDGLSLFGNGGFYCEKLTTRKIVASLELIVELGGQDFIVNNEHLSYKGYDIYHKGNLDVEQNSHPVGSQYTQYASSASNDLSVAFPTNESPAYLFGGTWEKLWDGEGIDFHTEGYNGSGRTNGLMPDNLQGFITLNGVGTNTSGSNPKIFVYGYTTEDVPGKAEDINAAANVDTTIQGKTSGPKSDGTNGTPRIGARTSDRNRLMRIWRRIA
ncbi:hypothetical protein [Sediminispirochaeta smaragdinae]|uniref:Uncharacterized protein n=1 Tax=Sediminispirochaeta smaragdinae (strain DSM 11293 / JCM 15392 / SEBR 4228) TaxID=573413 RepID=E1R3G9_SEDSS|nr:hypothetical protein [Sediminispirochaeta smaragdinae]ADK81600.1 hypothetical protein Spirs_2487 [Sediminispirochaeta smaragdinae DSM 11293]